MRFPKKGEDLTGKVCICSAGRIAVVSHQQDLTFSTGDNADQPTACWVGVGFDGRGAWASSAPVVAYKSLADYLRVINERFGGRMSKNA